MVEKSNCDQPYILLQPQLDFLSPPEKIWFVQFFVLYLYGQMQLDLMTLTGNLILGHKKTPRFHEGFSFKPTDLKSGRSIFLLGEVKPTD